MWDYILFFTPEHQRLDYIRLDGIEQMYSII